MNDPSIDSADFFSTYGFEYSSRSGASPVLSKRQKSLQICLMVCNIVFLIFGSVLVSIGEYALKDQTNQIGGVTIVQGVIVMGAFIIILSVLGCVSAWCESRLLLTIYLVVLTLLTLILFFLSLAVYIEGDQSDYYLIQGWDSAPDSVRDSVQTALKCCGLINYADGKQAKRGCPTGSSSACLPIMSDTLQKNFAQAGACGIAFSVLMTVMVLFVCVLMKGVKQKQSLEEIRRYHAKIREAKESEGTSVTGTIKPSQRVPAYEYAIDVNDHEASTTRSKTLYEAVKTQIPSTFKKSQQNALDHLDQADDDLADDSGNVFGSPIQASSKSPQQPESSGSSQLQKPKKKKQRPQTETTEE